MEQKEVILHRWWRTKNIDFRRIDTGIHRIVIESFGEYNAHENGPDFFDAKIRIDDILWCGSVEIHIKSSDWNLHGHQLDANYNNVILHVVQEVDEEVYNSLGEKILTIQISPYKNTFKPKSKYSWIPCENRIQTCDELTIINELEHSLIDRLNRKTSLIHFQEMIYQFDYNAVFWLLLFRSFGNKAHQQSMEQLFVTAYPYLKKTESNLTPVLLGFANLEMNPSEREMWEFFKIKHTIRNFQSIIWKTKGFFPMSNPEIRIRQLAAIFPIMKYIDWSNMEVNDWLRMKDSLLKRKLLTSSQIDLILINAVVLYQWWYAGQIEDNVLRERVFALLMRLPPENNSIIRQWKSIGLHPKNAFDSQALLELKNQKCNFTRCLECKIGQKLYEFSDKQIAKMGCKD